MKASSSLLAEQGVCREVAESSMEHCLSVVCGEYTRKGGCGNASLKGIFSLMTFGGLVIGFFSLYDTIASFVSNILDSAHPMIHLFSEVDGY